MIKFNCCETSAPARAKTTSVYDAIGGPAAVVAIVDNFHRRLLADPVLDPFFFPGGIGVRHRAYVISILGEALGGPKRYWGDMVGAHRGLGIGDAHFDRVGAHLDATLEELGIARELTDRIAAVVAGPRPAVVGVV